jgi:hypothetical protein
MQEKIKSTLLIAAISVAAIWALYYWGNRAIDFMVKMHGS